MPTSLKEAATMLHMKSYPKHFHDGSDEEIKKGEFGEYPKEVLRAFLQIARTKIHR